MASKYLIKTKKNEGTIYILYITNSYVPTLPF